MTKAGKTSITLVLDRSGSMDAVRGETIQGVNKFLAEQKNLPGEATFTLVQFNHRYEMVCLDQPLEQVPPLTEDTYVPDGYTALLDAVGRTISALGQRLAMMPEAERPEKVIFVIQTDGQENHSKEYSYERICEMIQHQRDKYAWEFLFLGADESTIQVAEAMGIPQGAALQYAACPRGVSRLFSTAAAAVTDRRRGLRSRDTMFTEEERQANRGQGNGQA